MDRDAGSDWGFDEEKLLFVLWRFGNKLNSAEVEAKWGVGGADDVEALAELLAIVPPPKENE